MSTIVTEEHLTPAMIARRMLRNAKVISTAISPEGLASLSDDLRIFACAMETSSARLGKKLTHARKFVDASAKLLENGDDAESVGMLVDAIDILEQAAMDETGAKAKLARGWTRFRVKLADAIDPRQKNMIL